MSLDISENVLYMYVQMQRQPLESDMTHSEILKAAHRQARRMEFVGGPSYAARLSVAMRETYAAARKPVAFTSAFADRAVTFNCAA